MSPPAAFMDRICALVAARPPLSARDRGEAVLAFEDTYAVALAGWREPVSQACARLYGVGAPLADPFAGAAEHVAFVHATAGHALDYDDVHLVSVTHPSVVIAPALLALAEARPQARARVLGAFAVGVAVNIALGRALGFQHYELGWHATSTIGPLAGAAAASHLLGLDEAQTRSALALAAAQAGGLQRNFASMAKPAQAGFASAAAVRAALMAEAGVTGDADAFAAKGYLVLYGEPAALARAAQTPIEIDMGSLSRKLYPCCYAAHRMIAAALAARVQLNAAQIAAARFRVDVPAGTMRPLRVTDPRDGAEGKFCGAYIVAVALQTGAVTLGDFTAAAVRRAEIRALMARIEIVEENHPGQIPPALEHGVVRVEAATDGRLLAAAECRYSPGSPGAPAAAAQMDTKIHDCLAAFGMAPAAFRTALHPRIGL